MVDIAYAKPRFELRMGNLEGGKGWMAAARSYPRGLQLDSHNAIPRCLPCTHSDCKSSTAIVILPCDIYDLFIYHINIGFSPTTAQPP